MKVLKWFKYSRLCLIHSSFLHSLFIMFVQFMATRVGRSGNSYLSVSVLIGLNKLPLLLINYECSIFKVG